MEGNAMQLPRSITCCFVFWFLIQGCLYSAFAAAPREVEFLSGALPRDPPLKITASLYKPEGSGPFPAIVHLHGCRGNPKNSYQLVTQLLNWGYVSLVVDSLKPRGLKSVCGTPRKLLPITRSHDAYGALKYLRGLAFVDSKRIGVIGKSHGGWTLLSALRADKTNPSIPSKLFTSDEKVRFKAAVTYFPWCPTQRRIFYAPLLILIGEKDDRTPAWRCQRMAENSLAGGRPVSLVVYPGATHAFASGFNVTVLGHRIVHDPAAAEDSLKRIKAFLAENL